MTITEFLQDTHILSSIILVFFAFLVTFYYSYQSSKREEDRIMKELFSEFNSRYDKLNDSLAIIEMNYKSYEQFKELSLTNEDEYKMLKQVVIDFSTFVQRNTTGIKRRE